MMGFRGRYRGIAIALALNATITLSAHASTILETAAFTGVDNGEYIIKADRFIAASFEVNKSTAITGIGGEFGGYPSGTIFGAIVPLATLTSYPSVPPSQIPTISLADVVFSASGSPPPVGNDLLEPLSVVLNPGAYAVVFGSGLFGASGNAGLGDANTTIGSPVFFQRFDAGGPPFDAWAPFGGQGVRIVVEGVSVPGPVVGAGLPGLIFGAGGLLAGWRRSKRAS